jgi:hypothetical protein
MDFEDIENEIPVNNIQLSQGLSTLQVKVFKQNEQGYQETQIERVKLQNDRQIFIARPFPRGRQVSSTISLAIQDVKVATPQEDNSWQIYDVFFRRVLVYGKVDVLNHFSRNDKRTTYKFLVDDGSESIIATLNVSKDTKNKGKQSRKSPCYDNTEYCDRIS